MTRVVRRAQDIDLSNLCTKADLAETKSEILKWMIGSFGVQTVVILGTVVALVKTLVH